MTVREATGADAPAIRQVAERAWSTDYPDIISRESVAAGVTEWYDDDLMRADIARADAAVFVAEADDGVVGFVHGVRGDEDGNVLRVYVDPDHRGNGLGSILLEAATDRLFEMGVDRVRAMVLEANDPGNEFYRSHGFERTDDTYETEIGGEFYDERVWVLERETGTDPATPERSPASQ